MKDSEKRQEARRVLRKHGYSEKEIKKVLDTMSTQQQEAVVTSVIRPITTALECFKQIYANLLLLPETPAVSLRTDTLQTLLSHFEAELGVKFNKVLKDAGKSIGKSFANDFINNLKSLNYVPLDLNALITLWLTIESNAKWGDFSLKRMSQNKLRIEIDNFFLTRGLVENPHRSCSFMEGYIESFLWVTSKTCSRWYATEYGGFDRKKFMEPFSVKEEPFGSKCRFEITLKTEELTDAFDDIYEAQLSCDIADYKKIALSLRTALEKSFKIKVGIEIGKQVSITSIIKAFRELEYLDSTSYRIIKDLYGRTSAIIHGSIKRPAKEDCESLVADAEYVLKVLELLDISDAQKRRVIELI